MGEPTGAVVSGLPWTVMPRKRREHTLDAVAEVLNPAAGAPPSPPST
ncbi:hypothetical protein N7U49_02495 [Streptomyces sp. AD2-2]|nr:hypothetical protein N7U49_02495 [Streptomyces sp. AD2-2]